MAGVIPGVESARRRRFHQASSSHGRPGTGAATYSFCWRHSRNMMMGSSSTYLQPNPKAVVGYDDSMLDEAAKEAKKRLDERLQSYTAWKPPQSKQSILSHRGTQLLTVRTRDQEAVVVAAAVAVPKRPEKGGRDDKKKKSVGGGGGGMKLRWRWSEQEECAVCLEPLQYEQQQQQKQLDNDMMSSRMNTMLPCAHKFHTKCVTPWLLQHPNSSSCPCCRIHFTSSSHL